MDLSAIQPFLNWVQNHPGLSGAVVFTIAAVESLAVVGILVPGVVFMLGIGALIGLGVLDLWATMFWAAGGAIAGDGVSYWFGRHFDKQLRSMWPFTKHPELIPRGEQFFHKHGGKSVLFGRFIGPIRPIIPAVAGIMHMNPYHFYFVNILSAIAWAPVMLLPGAVFGSSLHLASEVAGRLVVVLLILLGFVWMLVVGVRTLVTPFLLKVFGRWEEQWDFVVRNAFNSAIVLVVLTLAVGSYYLYVNSEQAFRSIVPINDAELWWQTGWEKVPVYRDGRAQQDPFTLQWWGNIDSIKENLQQHGWHVASTLSLENAILWLSPTPQIELLPLFSRRFNGKKQTLLLVKKLDERQQLVLRLWPAYRTRKLQNVNLWVATVSLMKLEEGWHKIFYAHISPDRNFMEKKLSMTLPENVRVNKVVRGTASDIWEGEVLLIMQR